MTFGLWKTVVRSGNGCLTPEHQKGHALSPSLSFSRRMAMEFLPPLHYLAIVWFSSFHFFSLLPSLPSFHPSCLHFLPSLPAFLPACLPHFPPPFLVARLLSYVCLGWIYFSFLLFLICPLQAKTIKADALSAPGSL